MRPPLPSVYDANAISAHFSGAAGASALRQRAFFIASTASSILLPSASIATSIEALGATFIKFGQAAANRPDLVGPAIADELRLLQDSCAPFSRDQVIQAIREDLPDDAAEEVLAALPDEPSAAASLGQVYRLTLPSQRDPIALKILRPGAREAVALDALLARNAATILEKLEWNGKRLIKPALVDGVDEFFSRLFEEMDYANELRNIQSFGSLYSRGRPAARALKRSARNWSSSSGRGGGQRQNAAGEIVVPSALPRWSNGRVLAMSWLEGEPLLKRGEATLPASELPLVRFGIEATLSQMLEEGFMHADPHGGNLLRAPPRSPSRVGRFFRRILRRPQPPPRLAYLDFGLVSDVPLQVREALVCAVALLLFDRDIPKVAGLFTELMLLPDEELTKPDTRKGLEDALSALADKVLIEPSDKASGELPTLRFDALITELAFLAPRFALQLPPYFLNNARALATLEGMARSADPSFDVLQAVYPFALRRLLADPRDSPLLRSTLDALTRDEATGRLDLLRVRRLLDDASRLSGRPRRQLVIEAAQTPGGRRLAREVAAATVRKRFA